MSEIFYDEKLSPLLKQVSKLCKEANLPFFAQVEFVPDGFGFESYSGENNIAFRLLYYAALSEGNIDKLILSIIMGGKKFGHNSIFLKQLEKKEPPHDPV